ncbi:MAG: Cupredoxin-like domain [Chloroflexota bacterium]|jgi:plastocyanin|nr:Cupredoxin-like domain [Chloroflexota bacterium]
MSTFRPAWGVACLAILASLAILAALAGCGSSAPPTARPSLPADAVLFTAHGSRFTGDAVQVPADAAWTLALDNQDGLPHNVVIIDAGGTTVFSSTLFTGPDLRSEAAQPLPAGVYRFTCAVHSDMKGTLTVP